VDGQHWVELMREPDAMRFGDQAELRAIPIEGPGAPLLRDF
jgi:hypothetical protein